MKFAYKTVKVWRQIAAKEIVTYHRHGSNYRRRSSQTCRSTSLTFHQASMKNPQTVQLYDDGSPFVGSFGGVTATVRY